MTVCPGMVASEVNPRPNSFSCNSRYCSVCGDRWQKDMRVMAVAAAEHVPEHVGLITVTAPGDDYFSDDEWKVVGGRPVIERWWNGDARERFRLFHRDASKGPREYAESHGETWEVLFRAWEYQKRGLLHAHIVVPMGTPVQEVASRMYLANLWSWARTYDFGYVLGGTKGTGTNWSTPPVLARASGKDAARYVCKYVASVGAGKEGMRDTARRTAQRGSVLYVARSLTRASGVTMTGLRNRRRIWARYAWARDGGEAWEQARLIEAAQRGRPRFTPAAVQRLRLALSRTGACLLRVAGGGEVYSRIPAPPPPQNGRTPLPGPPRTGVVDAVLAPVLLRVPGAGSRGLYGMVVVATTV